VRLVHLLVALEAVARRLQHVLQIGLLESVERVQLDDLIYLG